MTRMIRLGYLLCTLFFMGLFVFLLINFRLDIRERKSTEEYRIVDAQYKDVIKDDKAPSGEKISYSIPIDRVRRSYRHLIFLTIHQEVTVYAGEERIYHMQLAKGRRLIGKSPGCVWNDVALPEDCKEVRVELVPMYASATATPVFYLGAKYSIYKNILKSYFLENLLALITMVMGIVFLVYISINSRNTEVDKSLAMLGAFSLAMGLWKFSDGSLSKVLFAKYPAISMLPFLCLISVSVPMIGYLREMHSKKEHVIWKALCVICLIESFVALGLQYLNLLDFRESFLFTIVVIAIGVLGCSYMVADELKRNVHNKRLRVNVISLAICFAGIVLDFATYYASGQTTTSMLGMFIFTCYIFMQGRMALKDAEELTAIGRKSQSYEQMAYHDLMTGLFNRSAMNRDTDKDVFDPEHTIVIAFDLNHLKKYNDTLGHEKGDQYIKESAQIIQSSFGSLGKCYRTGGDEFWCLASGQGLEACKKNVELMHQKIEAYNTKNNEAIQMAIACGYARFDKRLDYDIQDTMRRADENMYKDKARLKLKEAEAQPKDNIE